jgi:protein-tyrosine phosphatase
MVPVAVCIVPWVIELPIGVVLPHRGWSFIECMCSMSSWRRWLALLVCVTAFSSAHADSASPFQSVSVKQVGRDYELSWRAPTAELVKVYVIPDQPVSDRSRRIEQGPGIGVATVRGLPPKSRWYFEFVADDGPSVIVTDRSLHLPSASNFRDAGGYRTEEGRWVRMGLAYRSNSLGALSPADHDTIQALRLKLVCDLRLDDERLRIPDPVFSDSNAISANVAADSGHRASGLRAALSSRDPAALVNFMKGAYRDFVDMPSAQAAYHEMFERLADPDNLPTVFHCTAGKDRTGWAQAILLSILKVPRRTIMEDYVLTDQFMSAAALEQIHKSMPEATDRAAGAIVRTDPAYLEAAFHEVDERYGSFEAYLDRGLHLDAATLDAIRRNFLSR